MDGFGIEPARASTLQSFHDRIAIQSMCANDGMYVLRQYRASVDRQLQLRDDRRKSPADGPGLDTREHGGRSRERFFRRHSQRTVVRSFRYRASRADFRGFAARFVKMVGTNMGGAAAAWIVREPKAVGGEDEMCSQHGGISVI
jgi:uncharacterized protein involved in type VI secretion and phage assembly